MNAARPPSFCVSAMICRARVVLPLDSGPKISMTRPLGTPPTPRARSSAKAPVEIEATLRCPSSPMRIIEPLPNCRSICDTAAAIALFLSCATLRSVTRYPLHFLASSARSFHAVLVIIQHEDGIYYGETFLDSGGPKEQWLVTPRCYPISVGDKGEDRARKSPRKHRPHTPADARNTYKTPLFKSGDAGFELATSAV